MIYNNKVLRGVLDVLVQVEPEHQGMIDAMDFARRLEGVREGGFDSDLNENLEMFLNIAGFLLAQKALQRLTDEQYEQLQAIDQIRMDECINKMYVMRVPPITAGLVASSLTHDLLSGTGDKTWNAVMAVIDSQLPATTDAEC